MGRYDDARRSLHQMEDALWDEEDYEDDCEEESGDEDWDDGYEDDEDEYEEDTEDEDEEDEDTYADAAVFARRRRRGRFDRSAGAEFDDAAAVMPRQNRRVGKLLLLLILEIAAIAAIVRWWIQWL